MTRSMASRSRPGSASPVGFAKLTVTLRTGYDFAQVFAPPGQEFICFEPMTATGDALNTGDGLRIVAPGREYRAEFTVAIANTSPSRPADGP